MLTKILMAGVALTVSSAAHAFEPAPDASSLSKAFPGKSYSPYAQRGFPSRLLWGDTHLHTSTSFDAGAFGNRLNAREALKTGLKLEARLGTNPYKFGMVGSTDSHTSLATAREDNFFGKHSGTEPNPERPSHIVAQFGDVAILGWEQVASGLAAVWTSENSHEAIFDAMKRKKVYATTGSRMAVRFFGGWDYSQDDLASRTPAFAGYEKGAHGR